MFCTAPEGFLLVVRPVAGGEASRMCVCSLRECCACLDSYGRALREAGSVLGQK